MIPVIAPDIGSLRGHAAKRLSILDAAAHVFCREGYGGANIDMVAMEAGVSRQTIYNHHGDKEKLFLAVVREVTERINAGIFDTLSTFPDKPGDLHADLTAFGIRMVRNCICSRDGRFLRKLIQSEGDRYPELFATWLKDGPGRTWSALAARFARLALAGHLQLDDPDLAARQFLALVRVDLEMGMMLGVTPTESELQTSASAAVTTFLRAYARADRP
ncbi:TetR/AcrR family transcriptional regulator [Arvimicrobium flavum]|uniref:TetR/AcrR family transcriptional regulator n=1 Tax=Arvimicrobium flavum TaxID=3393320 RepID=UPI00237C2F97|nr:TetR/AcrR family transcriptional regulator [Mesorhizobium shangrilense]